MRFMNEQQRLELLRQLTATYEALGRQGLEAMRPGQVRMLLADKQLELNITSRRVNQYPHDEVGVLRKAKLERELTDLHCFLLDERAKAKDGPELDMG